MGLLYDAWAGLWLKLAPESELSTTTWPPASLYDPQRDMADQGGKTVLITGGNSGVGYESAKLLLHKNARVYIAGRSLARIEDAIARLEKETGNRAIALELDLADLGSVKKGAVEFLKRERQLNVLFCNAGVFWSDVGLFTKQGYDLQFGTNVVGHYLLSTLLMPALRASITATGVKSRLIHTSSGSHAHPPTGAINFPTLLQGPERDEVIQKWPAVVAPLLLYGQSKMGNNLVANIFDRLHHEQLVSCAVHPGLVRTPLYKQAPWWQEMMMNWFSWPGAMGALSPVYAATAEEGEGFGGKYLIPWARVGKADPRAEDVELQDKLKQWLDEQIKEWV